MAKSKKNKPPAIVAQEHGSVWLRQHAEVVHDETMVAGITRARVKCECRLDWYEHRALINERQHAAGLRFRVDWCIGSEEQCIIGSYGQTLRGGTAEFSEAKVAARRRVNRAVAALSVSEAKAAIAVCGMDEWASGSLPTLRDALTTLAKHYGLPDERH